jgi:hypothetical protein
MQFSANFLLIEAISAKEKENFKLHAREFKSFSYDAHHVAKYWWH